MGHTLHFVATDAIHFGAQGGDALDVIIGEVGEFLVAIDVGEDMGRLVDHLFHFLKHGRIRFVGKESRDARARLPGVGHVGDDNPVAMSQGGHHLVELDVPFFRCELCLRVAPVGRVRGKVTGGEDGEEKNSCD